MKGKYIDGNSTINPKIIEDITAYDLLKLEDETNKNIYAIGKKLGNWTELDNTYFRNQREEMAERARSGLTIHKTSDQANIVINAYNNMMEQLKNKEFTKQFKI